LSACRVGTDAAWTPRPHPLYRDPFPPSEVWMDALEGKVVAITGSGRGIGPAVAEFCASEGASVVVNDYGVSIDGNEPTSDVADEVVDSIRAAGGNAVANASSVTTMEGGASIVQSAVDTFGRIDGV